MIRIAIFDLDGTLVNTLASLAYSVNSCLKKLGYPEHPPENYKYYCGEGADLMLQRSLSDAGDKELRDLPELRTLYRDFFKTGCLYQAAPYEGICDILEHMKQANIKVTVLTNKAHENAVSVLDQAFGRNYFDLIMGQSPDWPRKPSPEGVKRILDRFALTPADGIYIGDTATDMLTGKAAKMLTIGAGWGFRTEAELAANGADQIIFSPIELNQFI